MAVTVAEVIGLDYLALIKNDHFVGGIHREVGGLIMDIPPNLAVRRVGTDVSVIMATVRGVGARSRRLGPQRLHRPAGRHLGGQDPFQVLIHVHVANGPV